MTRQEFDALVYKARKQTEDRWPYAPKFAEHEYQVPVLIDLVVQLFDRIEKLENGEPK